MDRPLGFSTRYTSIQAVLPAKIGSPTATTISKSPIGQGRPDRPSGSSAGHIRGCTAAGTVAFKDDPATIVAIMVSDLGDPHSRGPPIPCCPVFGTILRTGGRRSSPILRFIDARPLLFASVSKWMSVARTAATVSVATCAVAALHGATLNSTAAVA
jgi:hypothetical protein